MTVKLVREYYQHPLQLEELADEIRQQRIDIEGWEDFAIWIKSKLKEEKWALTPASPPHANFAEVWEAMLRTVNDYLQQLKTELDAMREQEQYLTMQT